MRSPLLLLTLAGLSVTFLNAQTFTTRPSMPKASAQPEPPNLIQLTVPAGTPLKVVVDKDTRLRNSGQEIRGRLIAPVYAFDKLVIPAGTQVNGKVAEIESVPKAKRILAAMNGDFTPLHQVRLEFNELVLPNGNKLTIHTSVTPGSNGVLEFVPAAASRDRHDGVAKDEVSKKAGEARDLAKQEWISVKRLWHDPGKLHKLERLAEGQSPYRPQRIEAGTGFNATLEQPLEFGQEQQTTENLKTVGSQPPAGSVVHAWLATPLSSATATAGMPVEAVLGEPLFADGKLVLPQGSVVKGTVLQVHSARRLNRNGQLRIAFHDIVPPGGKIQKVETSLEGVEVAKGDHLKLDSEGGAEVTTPKSVYLGTSVQIALAAASGLDRDVGHPNPSGDLGKNAANGLSGFGFVGTILTAAAHSRSVATGFGAYGAGLSLYSHFMTRGHEVVYPKYMMMVMGISEPSARTKRQEWHLAWPLLSFRDFE